MMAFDMGGPVNKAAYTFSLGMLASNVYGPMAAVMAAGMTPPLGIALATVLFKKRFNALERDGGKATAILGLSFITEGAIPYAAEDPFRVIPCLMLGSAVTGAISMATGVQLMVPHGGVASSAEVVTTLMYNRAFQSNQLGIATAMATMLLLAIFVLSLLTNRFTKRQVVEF